MKNKEVIQADIEKLERIVKHAKNNNHSKAILKGRIEEFSGNIENALNVIPNEPIDD